MTVEANSERSPARCFEIYLAPFRDMDVPTISEKQTSGVDHQSSEYDGLPAFQFIQDRLDYSHAVPEDLIHASAVCATAHAKFKIFYGTLF